MGVLNIFKRNNITVPANMFNNADRLARSLYQWVTPGTMLDRDGDLSEYIKQGYEGNVDVYSFINRLSDLFSQIELEVQDERGNKVERSEIQFLIDRPNSYQSGIEFRKLACTFLLASGNNIMYGPRLGGGNNAGKLLPAISGGGLFNAPSQYVEIKSNGPFSPVGGYVIDFNNQEGLELPPEHVTHVRFPNLEYLGGQHFMGMSPLKAAADLINAQNLGYKITANTYKHPIPPAIVSDEGATSVEGGVLKREWRKKYANPDSQEYGIPVFTAGKIQYIPLTMSNLNDLQIIPNSQEGRRALANVFSVPAQLFNDMSATAFNNMSEAKKAIYVNRVIPDMKLWLSEINYSVSRFYDNGRNKIVALFNEIPEMQEDLKEKSIWVFGMVDRGIYSRNDALEKMGEERVNDKDMDVRTVNMNTIPLNEALSIDEPDPVNDPSNIIEDNEL